ncbi:MAG TPA: hypothetical protein VG890_08630 [Puia sp.]|nr:hypothetical protein [Puia sp.]
MIFKKRQSQVWRSRGDGIERKYDYKYDDANRITRAEYTQNTSGSAWDANTLDFSVWGFDSDNGYGIKYDANGNIQMLIQKGYTNGQTSIIDALRYTYFTNKNNLFYSNNIKSRVYQGFVALERMHEIRKKVTLRRWCSRSDTNKNMN